MTLFYIKLKYFEINIIKIMNSLEEDYLLVEQN